MPEPSTGPQPKRWKELWTRFWDAKTPRQALVRDVAVAGGAVLLLLAGVWIYSGQPLSRAPVVSVESGSMMHAGAGFGRVGTIDPGDITFVKDVDALTDIHPAFDPAAKHTYGGPGDVIVYRPYGLAGATRIIHRSMLLVLAEPEGCVPNQNCVYRIPAACDPRFEEWNQGASLAEYCEGSSSPIDIHLAREGVRADFDGYPCVDARCEPFYSSFITKGDNNGQVDQQQPGRISSPVRLEWIMGKARGEVPWFGLIKLAIYGNKNYDPSTDPTHGANWLILNARAPRDIWICLFLSVAVLVAIPMVVDAVSARMRKESDEKS